MIDKCRKKGDDLPYRPKEHAMIASSNQDEFNWDDEVYFDVDMALMVTCKEVQRGLITRPIGRTHPPHMLLP